MTVEKIASQVRKQLIGNLKSRWLMVKFVNCRCLMKIGLRSQTKT
jgi:hypothetical protein